MKKKKLKNNFLLAMVVTCVMAVMLAGCGKSFDAAEHTQATLDAALKGEFDKYEKVTGQDKSALEESYNKMIDDSTQALCSAFDGQLSDKLINRYKDVVVKLYQKSNYTVGKAVEDGDAYTVDVTILQSAKQSQSNFS